VTRIEARAERGERGTRVEAVVSDFGGVLTSPVFDSFLAWQKATGIPLEALGKAMAELAERHGAHPLFELETGRIREEDFLEVLSQQLSAELGRKVRLEGFADRYLEQLDTNPRMIEYMRELRERGYKMAICTNNIREWEERWRAKLPVDEIFDVVVDSSAVGTRKPEPRIYEITLERLGVEPSATVFVDDLEVNCTAARELGMSAVWFRDTGQAIEEIETALEDLPTTGTDG
jgi:putative hydrolase of the HAD superfamily